MSPIEIFAELLELARADRLDQVSSLYGAGNRHVVVGLSMNKPEAVSYMRSLPPADQILFVKAIAAYENTVGGMGSPTLLHRLFPVLEDPERHALEWVLRNTQSYSYYAPPDARTLKEYDAENERIRVYQASQRKQVEDRENAARAKAANDATQRLSNAVRRGDVLAIAALLRKGANIQAAVAPNGGTLIDYARDLGREDILAALEGRSPLATDL